MIGLLGGAFDPPHNGHVALADAAERQLGLDRLVVVVVADPGHRDVHLPAETRLELARLAFPGREVVLDHHARTVDMLRDGPWDDPVFLIGADEFLDFGSWKEPEEVLELARLGVATRPGYAAGRPRLGPRPLLRDRARSRLLARDPGARSRAGSRSTGSSRRRSLPRSPAKACTAARLTRSRRGELTDTTRARTPHCRPRPGEAGQGRRHPGHDARCARTPTTS